MCTPSGGGGGACVESPSTCNHPAKDPTYHWSSSTVSLTISTTVPPISGTVHASRKLFYHPVVSTSSTAFRLTFMKYYIELSLLTASSSNLRRSLSASASCAFAVVLQGGSRFRSCLHC